jgi:cytochrome c peroxidase
LGDFVLTACANELGLEVPGHHQAASPLDPDAKARRMDLTQDECDALVAYVRSLPPPIQLAPSEAPGSAAITEGRKLFQSVGCATCHIPDLGTIRGIYSDLLLHNMGEELSDPGSYDTDDADSPGAPERGEWRTPPLWGFRDSGPYLHDGRAQNLEQAVALHGGQGATSAHRFHLLTRAQQALVQAFLNSLVAPGSAGSPEVLRAAGTETHSQPN